MRRPRYIDFRCAACGREEERLVETDEDGAPLTVELCPDDKSNLSIVPNLKIGDVLGRTKYPVEEDVVRA